jgi:hypothetical protein
MTAHLLRGVINWSLTIGELLIPATTVVYRNFQSPLCLPVSPFPQAAPHQYSA